MKLIKEVITEQRTANVTYLKLEDDNGNILAIRRVEEEPLETIEEDTILTEEYNEDNVDGIYSIEAMYLEAMGYGHDFTIVRWPESQEYMEKEWFEKEAHLINDDFGLKYFGSQAYIIPLTRVPF